MRTAVPDGGRARVYAGLSRSTEGCWALPSQAAFRVAHHATHTPRRWGWRGREVGIACPWKTAEVEPSALSRK
jgi:hypothetical protein